MPDCFWSHFESTRGNILSWTVSGCSDYWLSKTAFSSWTCTYSGFLSKYDWDECETINSLIENGTCSFRHSIPQLKLQSKDTNWWSTLVLQLICIHRFVFHFHIDTIWVKKIENTLCSLSIPSKNNIKETDKFNAHCTC